MGPHLTVSYMAVDVERTLLPAQAERGWLAAQAQAAGRGHSPNPVRLRRYAGTLLVHAGERLHGATRLVGHTEPRPAVGTLEP